MMTAILDAGGIVEFTRRGGWADIVGLRSPGK
jgi:hypothetical protein